MRSNYKQLGPFIRPVDIRNRNEEDLPLLGVSVQKVFIPSIANTVGTDFSKYKKVKFNQFTYIPDTSRRGDKIGIAMLSEYDEALVSQAYTVFEIIDHSLLDPSYLMMWFRRPEFDRYARFKSHGSVREIFDWQELCETELPIPSIEKQREIVREYNTIVNRIALNEQLIQKLEETAQAIYKSWFVEGLDEDKVKLKEYIETNPKLELKKGSYSTYIEMANLSELSMCISGKRKRDFIGGSKFQNDDILLARITPCLENGKTAFVNVLEKHEVAGGSTEFIVMRAKKGISPYWVYCLAKDENFRSFAISSMIGSSGRQRVHEKYLEEYDLPRIDLVIMQKFNNTAKPIFELIRLKSKEKEELHQIKFLLYSKMIKVQVSTEKERI